MDEDLINIDEIEEIKDSVSYGITEFPDKKNENDGKRGQDKTVRNKKEKLPPTDSLVTDNLVESFALLSSMLDEAKNTKKNLEKIHESIVDLLKVVTELRDVSEEFSKVNQIVKEINTLVKAISLNNTNIKDLINIIYKITDEQKKIKRDVDEIKNEIFFTGNDGSQKNKNSKKGNFLPVLNFVVNIATIVLLIYFFSHIGK